MLIFAYVAPEVVLPLASVLAAAFGFVLMVGRTPFRLASKWLRAARKGREEVGASRGRRVSGSPSHQTEVPPDPSAAEHV